MANMNTNNGNYELSITPTATNYNLTLNTKNKITTKNININFSAPTANIPNLSYSVIPGLLLDRKNYSSVEAKYRMGYYDINTSNYTNTIYSSNVFTTNSWYSGATTAYWNIQSKSIAFQGEANFEGIVYHNSTYVKGTTVHDGDSFDTDYRSAAVYDTNGDLKGYIPSNASGKKFKIDRTYTSFTWPSGSPWAGTTDYHFTFTLQIVDKNGNVTHDNIATYQTSYEHVHPNSGFKPENQTTQFKVGTEYYAIDSSKMDNSTIGIFFVITPDYVNPGIAFDAYDSGGFWPPDETPSWLEAGENFALWIDDSGVWNYYRPWISNQVPGKRGTCSRWVIYWSKSGSTYSPAYFNRMYLTGTLS